MQLFVNHKTAIDYERWINISGNNRTCPLYEDGIVLAVNIIFNDRKNNTLKVLSIRICITN